MLWLVLVARSAALWVDQVARPVLVFELTDSAFLVGVVFAARMAPNFVLGLFAGALVDRYPRKAVLAGSQVGNAVASGLVLLLLLFDTLEAWHVIVLVAVNGSSIAFFQPARQAILPMLVPPDALRPAVALSQTANNMMRIVGGILGGVLLAVASYTAIYGLMTALYAVVIVLALAIRAETRARGRDDPSQLSIWQSSLEGARWAIRERLPLAVLLPALVLFVFIVPYQGVFVPLLVIDVLGEDRSWVGYLVVAAGAGAVAGSLVVARMSTLPAAGPTMLGVLAAAGAVLALLGAAPHLGVAALLLLLMGASTTAFMTVSNLTMLNLAPPEMHGRALSLMNFARGLIPVGALVSGALAEEFGARTGLAAMGLATVAAVILVGAWAPLARFERAPASATEDGAAAPGEHDGGLAHAGAPPREGSAPAPGGPDGG